MCANRNNAYNTHTSNTVTVSTSTFQEPAALHQPLEVADQKRLWVEGEAILFDDTYPHMVSHWGEQPRYVILVWFCHPCDGGNAHNQTCPDS